MALCWFTNNVQTPTETHAGAERQALAFILGIVLLRLLWHLLEPVGMAGDETYYWLWGRYPDWGYFSKPPLIGWLYGGLTEFIGQSVYVYKAAATLLGGGTLWFFYRMLVLLTDNREMARYGLLAFALLPASLLLASILTIDAPLLFCWTGGMYFTARLLATDKPRASDYLGLFILLGLGHLSKQMMLVQLPLIVVIVASHRRSLLTSVWFWLALLGSLVALLPPVLWNSQNNWITIEHTAHHFEPGSSSLNLGKSLTWLGEFWGALAGLFSPILFFAFFPALKTGWQKRRECTVLFFILFGAAGLVVMSCMAFRQRVNPNWPAAFLPASLGLILVWAFTSDARKRWLKRGIWLAGGMSVFLMVLLILLEPMATSLANMGMKPQRRGWQGYPQLVQTINNLTEPAADQLIFVGHRFTASQFAFHGPDPKRVHLWNNSGHFKSQFDFFNAPETGKPVVIVVERKKEKSEGELPNEIRALLGEVRELDELPMHPARDYPRFKIYLADTLKDWISH